MFSYYAILVLTLSLAAAVLAGIDGGMRLRRAARPLAIAVLVLAIVLLFTLVAWYFLGLLPLAAAVMVLLLVALIAQFATDPAGQRRKLTIVAAVVTLLALVSLWPIVGLLATT
ncbi:MAG: hypothetical protein ABI566_14040 [Pseudolysinimonas sp.]